MANFKELNRYTNGQSFKTRAGKDFLVLRKPLNLIKSDGDTYITITQDLLQRPDLIAYKAYGNPDLWWAIYEFNGIRDPLFELTLNQILRIPDIDRLVEAINNIGTT